MSAAAGELPRRPHLLCFFSLHLRLGNIGKEDKIPNPPSALSTSPAGERRCRRSRPDPVLAPLHSFFSLPPIFHSGFKVAWIRLPARPNAARRIIAGIRRPSLVVLADGRGRLGHSCLGHHLASTMPDSDGFATVPKTRGTELLENTQPRRLHAPALLPDSIPSLAQYQDLTNKTQGPRLLMN
uniref:Uncharacterized protein n=1 Tax=Aegilops tauschii TaxID=37682 RepID=M8BZ93_AEGTA